MATVLAAWFLGFLVGVFFTTFAIAMARAADR